MELPMAARSRQTTSRIDLSRTRCMTLSCVEEKRHLRSMRTTFPRRTTWSRNLPVRILTIVPRGTPWRTCGGGSGRRDSQFEDEQGCHFPLVTNEMIGETPQLQSAGKFGGPVADCDCLSRVIRVTKGTPRSRAPRFSDLRLRSCFSARGATLSATSRFGAIDLRKWLPSSRRRRIFSLFL